MHVVYSTKHRHPWIDPEVRPRLHGYLATVARDVGCEAYRVGGVDDHVHFAISLGRTITIAKFIEKTKTASSGWMKKQGDAYSDFYWQGGYGAFSVSEAHLDPLLRYIDNQEGHHKTETFQDEFRCICKKHGIELDERYAWE